MEFSRVFLTTAPNDAIRYVVWHEVCHISFNHVGYSLAQEQVTEVCVSRNMGPEYPQARRSFDRWDHILKHAFTDPEIQAEAPKYPWQLIPEWAK